MSLFHFISLFQSGLMKENNEKENLTHHKVNFLYILLFRTCALKDKLLQSKADQTSSETCYTQLRVTFSQEHTKKTPQNSQEFKSPITSSVKDKPSGLQFWVFFMGYSQNFDFLVLFQLISFSGKLAIRITVFNNDLCQLQD